jgi:hypothetical protein
MQRTNATGTFLISEPTNWLCFVGVLLERERRIRVKQVDAVAHRLAILGEIAAIEPAPERWAPPKVWVNYWLKTMSSSWDARERKSGR